MKKTWVILVNVFIMLALLTFVVLYSGFENRNNTRMQIEHFENTTITMEHVTENYLEGEQRICDVWAHYINSKDMTIEESVDFIRISHVLPSASAHLVYLDTRSGLSTRARPDNPDDYSVSYARMELLNDVSWIHDIGESINISRAYTNPVNGEQSLAFCNFITLHDPETDEPRSAILLRIPGTPSSVATCWQAAPHQSVHGLPSTVNSGSAFSFMVVRDGYIKRSVASSPLLWTVMRSKKVARGA